MKGPRGPPGRRRSALKYFMLTAPLVVLAYILSRRESNALTSVVQSESLKDAAAPLVVLLRDDDDESRPLGQTSDTTNGAAGLQSKFSVSGSLNAQQDVDDTAHHNDYEADGLEAALDGSAFDDDSDDFSNGDEPWQHENFDDNNEDDEEDPTGGAAFTGEGLDDDEEEETDDLALSVSEGGVPPPPTPSEFPDMVFGSAQDEDVKDVLEWMKKCTTLNCIIKAHDRLQGRTRFNFPHFFLVGWQKCATTSVNAYLRYHPQYLPGLKKEPHWFSVCQNNLEAPHCIPQTESEYLRDFLRLEEAVDSRLELVTLDASADYAGKGGPLARKLYRLFPWLKVVIMVREPISRLISYTRMHTQSTFQQWKACKAGSSLFTCLRPHLTPGAANSNYSDALMGWLTTFPTDQIHVIQFEELQETPDKVLYDLKSFLGMDVDLPDRTIANVNNRREGGGYPMGRGQYLRLVRMVKQDAERTAAMLDRYGLADKNAWMARWQAVWNGFLTNCPTFEEECRIDSN